MNLIPYINKPAELEILYREDKSAFKAAFFEIYDQHHDNPILQVWNERLKSDSDSVAWGTKKEWLMVLTLAFFAGLIAKLPDLITIDYDYYMPRNIGFIIFPALTGYFAWRHRLSTKFIGLAGFIFAGSALYINLLPNEPGSHTLILAGIHLPIFLWTVLGFIFTGASVSNYDQRIQFLRFNGDFLVMIAVLMLSGGILTGITIGLFELIGLDIAAFYMRNIGVWGLAAIPVLASFFVTINPQLVNKVSPIIARVFTPLVLVMLSVYLVAVMYTGKDPYNDRDFLIVFNALLIGVMALILFSVSETSKQKDNTLGIWILLLLSMLTIVVNGIALSAIVFRIAEWGITPNRLAVLGSNLLMLVNIMLVTVHLFRATQGKSDLNLVELTIARYLPVYSAWSALVTFLFPALFGFK